ncbi:unnamed protein product, partial [Allacma fusca]
FVTSLIQDNCCIGNDFTTREYMLFKMGDA